MIQSLRRLPVDIGLHVLLVELRSAMVNLLEVAGRVIGGHSLAALRVGSGAGIIII